MRPVSADASTITFELIQQFSGDACREQFGTAPEACASDIGFVDDPSATASMRVGFGAASVLDDRGGIDFTAYRITSNELARLLAGEPPADDAPEGYALAHHPYVVTVRNGSVTAADQMFIS